MDSRDAPTDIRNALEWSSGRWGFEGGYCFQLFVCRDGIPGEAELPLPHLWYSLRFENVASLARVNMSLMWEYYTGEGPNPPLLEELPYDGNRTFVEGFTVNTESHGNSWKYFRVSTRNEVIDLISDSAPSITQCSLDS